MVQYNSLPVAPPFSGPGPSISNENDSNLVYIPTNGYFYLLNTDGTKTLFAMRLDTNFYNDNSTFLANDTNIDSRNNSQYAVVQIGTQDTNGVITFIPYQTLNNTLLANQSLFSSNYDFFTDGGTAYMKGAFEPPVAVTTVIYYPTFNAVAVTFSIYNDDQGRHTSTPYSGPSVPNNTTPFPCTYDIASDKWTYGVKVVDAIVTSTTPTYGSVTLNMNNGARCRGIQFYSGSVDVTSKANYSSAGIVNSVNKFNQFSDPAPIANLSCSTFSSTFVAPPFPTAYCNAENLAVPYKTNAGTSGKAYSYPLVGGIGSYFINEVVPDLIPLPKTTGNTACDTGIGTYIAIQNNINIVTAQNANLLLVYNAALKDWQNQAGVYSRPPDFVLNGDSVQPSGRLPSTSIHIPYNCSQDNPIGTVNNQCESAAQQCGCLYAEDFKCTSSRTCYDSNSDKAAQGICTASNTDTQTKYMALKPEKPIQAEVQPSPN
ncbi:MAG: hypothetical protein EOP45_14465, partial [Sphingobacteriaceae bacterium]